ACGGLTRSRLPRCVLSLIVVNITTLEIGMDEVISAAEANRRFSHLLRGVREGRSYVVTSHGKPIARIGPPVESSESRRTARERLFARLESQPVQTGVRWTREELYEDDE